MYQNPKTKSLIKRGTPGVILGKNEETKGYKLLSPKYQTVITTRHVGQIEALSAEDNLKLKRFLDAEADADL